MTDLTTFSRRSFIVMPFALAACKPSDQVFEIVGNSMGTTFKVVAVDHTRGLKRAEIESTIATALQDVDQSVSNWNDSSEISLFNTSHADDVITPSPILSEILQASADVFHGSDGRFDASIGPLIELWGFGAPEGRGLPSDADIATAQAKTGLDRSIVMGAGTVQKAHDDAQLYLAGIGKGYGADHIGRGLEALGITDYLVEIGGDLYASGRNPNGTNWHIGIESPGGGQTLADVVGLSGRGLATSGDYRNYFEVDGERYSHLIDPTTGRPVTHKTASATVLADNAMLADAWSTAMLIVGRERGLEIAAEGGIAVQFVERDPNAATLQFKTHASEAFETLTA